MTKQVQRFSQDGKLYVGMSIDAINCDTTKKDKTKLIELFNKANKIPDDTLDEEEIKAYDHVRLCANQADSLSEEIEREINASAKAKKEKESSIWKKIMVGAGSIIGLGVAGCLAFKGITSYKNLTKELAQTKALLEQTSAELNATKSTLNDAEGVIAHILQLSKAPNKLSILDTYKNFMNNATPVLRTTNEFTSECGRLRKSITELF